MQAIANPNVTPPTAFRGTHRTLKITYWSLLGLFSLAMLMDGIAGVMREQTGQEVMRHLGYPIYAMIILGTAKIVGVVALLQSRFRTINEWAYAGFTINFIGAAASWALAGDSTGAVVPPLVMLAVLFLLYFVRNRFDRVKMSETPVNA